MALEQGLRRLGGVEQIKSTFFVVGSEARSRPACLAPVDRKAGALGRWPSYRKYISEDRFLEVLDASGGISSRSNAPRGSSLGPLALLSIVAVGVALALILSAPAAFAQSPTSSTSTSPALSDYSFDYLSAAAAIVGASAAAAYAVAKTATAAAAAIAERPASFGPMLILAGLGEGIAIYGLLVAFEILSKVP